jgi:TRAP-type C4-dicarboxylate transport system substrate-binding protein
VVVYFTTAMNNEKWNSLPADVQQQINSVSGLKGSQFWGENQFDSAASAGRDLAKKQGFEMVEYNMPDDQIAKWSTLAGQPLWDEWVKTQTSQGRPESKEIFGTVQDLIKTYKP